MRSACSPWLHLEVLGKGPKEGIGSIQAARNRSCIRRQRERGRHDAQHSSSNRSSSSGAAVAAAAAAAGAASGAVAVRYLSRCPEASDLAKADDPQGSGGALAGAVPLDCP